MTQQFIAERIHDLGRTRIRRFAAPFDLQAIARWALVLQDDLATVRYLSHLSASVRLGEVALIQVPVRHPISDVSELMLNRGFRLCEPLCAIVLLAQNPTLISQRGARTLVAPFRGPDRRIMACWVTETGSCRQVCVDGSESLVNASTVVIARC